MKFNSKLHFELRNKFPNFATKFSTSLATTNQIAKFVANFEKFEQTSEPIRQKLCETLCEAQVNSLCLGFKDGPKIWKPHQNNEEGEKPIVHSTMRVLD